MQWKCNTFSSQTKKQIEWKQNNNKNTPTRDWRMWIAHARRTHTKCVHTKLFTFDLVDGVRERLSAVITFRYVSFEWFFRFETTANDQSREQDHYEHYNFCTFDFYVVFILSLRLLLLLPQTNFFFLQNVKMYSRLLWCAHLFFLFSKEKKKRIIQIHIIYW